MSKKGMEPSLLVSSLENMMFGSIDFMCSRKLLLLAFLMMVKVSSTYIFHRTGGVGEVLMAWTSRSSINKLATMGLIGEP